MAPMRRAKAESGTRRLPSLAAPTGEPVTGDGEPGDGDGEPGDGDGEPVFSSLVHVVTVHEPVCETVSVLATPR